MPGMSGCVLVFVVCLCFTFNQTTCQVLPLSRLESNMHTFAANLAAFFKKTTALDGVKKDFRNANWTKVRELEVSTKLNEVKQKLNAVIKGKKKALEKLVKAAEKAYKQHTNTGDPQHSYPNAKNLSLKEFKLISDDKLGGTRVNLDMSSVHVPTDVYDQAPSILNAISWSSHLDATFKQNNDSSLTWQFFCSEDAHLRIYPGVQWRPPSEDAVLPSDVYDCRVQEWYIQASSFPKDVLVLLDVSGSMKGLNIEIAKTAVVKMLQTFTHDDFFNVLLYSDQVEFLEPCFQGAMVQATEVNKERIKTNLDLIKPRNIANLESALIVAFELLLSGRKHGASSNCNKMIMLMTDGGVQACFEVFEKYNATQNKIRIFTYLIGREVGESEFIKSLACLYSGSYYRISGFADVHEHIQRYLHVLSHQLSLGKSDRLAWSNTYYDVIEPGLGLVMTMAAPVYNSSSKTAALLGVVGTDFPVKEFINILNSCKIPVNGYWFVTNNGFTVTHPNLLAQPDVLTRRTSYALGINRMEVLDKNGKLKRNMLKGSDANVDMETLTTLTWEKVAIFSKNAFHFSTLEDSPFRLGLSLPGGYGQFQLLNLSDLLTSTSSYEDLQNLRNTNFTIARWSYCDKKDEILLDFLIDNKNNLPAIREICDEKLLQLLLNDVTITKMISDKWNKVLVRTPQRRIEDVEFVFVATQGGLSRYFHVNPTSDLLNEMKKQSSTTDQLFYKLSAHHGASIITFTVPSLENSSTNPVIVMSKPITDASEKSVLAVLGIALKQSLIEELLFRALKGCSDGDSRDNDGGQDNDDNDNNKCEDFCDNFCSYENVSCFLVDVYGYVVYSETQKNIGSFLGDVDQMNGLMQLLTIDHHDDREGSDHALFNRYTIVDLQSTCPISDEQTSSAVIHFSKPLEIILSSMKYFIRNFVTLSMEIFLLMESLVYLLFGHLIAPSSSQSCKNRQLSATTASSPLTFYEDEMTSFSYSSSIADESSELSVLDEYLMRQGFEIEDPDLRSMMMECYGKYVTQLDFQGKTTPIKNCFKEAKATWQKMNNRGNTTCFKHLMYYIANTSRLPLHGSLLTCDGECEKFYIAHLVPESNLIFLATESSCECEEKKAFLKYNQIKYENNSTYFCQLLKQEQQRGRFSKCSTPNEKEFMKCSSAHMFLSSHAVLLTLLIVLPLFVF